MAGVDGVSETPNYTPRGRTRPTNFGSVSIDMNESDAMEDVITPATTFLPSTTTTSLNHPHSAVCEEHEIRRLVDHERPNHQAGVEPVEPERSDNWKQLLMRLRQINRVSSRNIGLGTRERHWPCGLTNFHFSLCFGLVGFAVFWTGLLLRIYLPHKYFV